MEANLTPYETVEENQLYNNWLKINEFVVSKDSEFYYQRLFETTPEYNKLVEYLSITRKIYKK